ncbi:phosphodiester glycosidase family protein [Aquamicrobium defluvii]|uniref:Uncharacterized protein YigE (DUF2233 family) n=2 Tax=Aquamicrobium defluvii TaxID=69279 RepID=A0A011US41_9HYPH|nr:phosphodiester glycosidase family protein [Aquamicrobium defluvii]EXL09061.1 hypothetical protein BG36_24040 [Aquamicrobium defluvii]EZQ15361.1 hypothetical protein CF98_11685 [Halopseudomonas bauzanensis]TDR34622.1 uncharacterized protein YigE (DUF2233 family) [Aquamicrobium defluvii]
MRIVSLFLFAAVLIVAGFAATWWMRPVTPPQAPQSLAVPLPEPCRDVAFEGRTHIVCELDPAAHDIRIVHEDVNGKPFGSLLAFDAEMAGQGNTPLLSMNAGMYHKDLSPVGILVDDGREKTPLNLDDGEGNFFMKPNGVFMVGRDGRAAVMESSVYAQTLPDTLYATQSGPMLVIDGKIHPRFEPDGTSRYIRNGVGIDMQGRVVVAISRKPVSLGSFARLFRDELGCRNALFLDGAISTLTSAGKVVIGGKHPAGPILTVLEKR